MRLHAPNQRGHDRMRLLVQRLFDQLPLMHVAPVLPDAKGEPGSDEQSINSGRLPTHRTCFHVRYRTPEQSRRHDSTIQPRRLPQHACPHSPDLQQSLHFSGTRFFCRLFPSFWRPIVYNQHDRIRSSPLNTREPRHASLPTRPRTFRPSASKDNLPGLALERPPTRGRRVGRRVSGPCTRAGADRAAGRRPDGRQRRVVAVVDRQCAIPQAPSPPPSSTRPRPHVHGRGLPDRPVRGSALRCFPVDSGRRTADRPADARF